MGGSHKKKDGVYIDGFVHKVPVCVTVDTGATSTIISEQVYGRISKDSRPILKPIPNRRVSTANGSLLEMCGKARLILKLGPAQFEKDFLVAKIEDDVLLGGDILQRHRNGPADLILSKGVLRLNHMDIPVQQTSELGRDEVRKVRAADHVLVPGMSEVIVDTFVDGGADGAEKQVTLIEGTLDVVNRYMVLVAPTVVNLNSNATAKVCLLNPFPDTVSIKQDAVLGVATDVPQDQCSTMGIDKKNPASERARSVREQNSDKQEQVPQHLQALYDRTAKGRPPTEKAAIARLLTEFSDVFSKDSDDLGLTHLTEHVIDTQEHAPIKQPPHRVPMAFANEDVKSLEKLQRQGVIRPSNSPWASPIVLVRKKDGSVRFCTDFRKLNAVTKKDAFPIPRTEDCLDAVAGAVIFSTFDITSAYHQVPLRESDIPKTAFTTKYGLYEYLTMPFGLCNATATFQRLMELALSGLQWTTCLIFLDDVISFSSSFDQHVCDLRSILSRIRDAGLKLKPSKSQLFCSEVSFLGHVISEKGVLPNPDNVQKLCDWPVPKTQKQVRAFLGLGNYYRRFVKDYSKLVKPLTELLHKNAPLIWSNKCQESFEKLKAVLTGPEVMAYPRKEGEFVLDTDACGVSIGCVLSQIQDGVERVIAYGSRTLTRCEQNFCVTDRELLAVKHFVELYKHYLLGRRFTVRSDHQALVWLFSLKEPKDRIARWLESLSAFDFSVEYRQGAKHGNADAMSRCPNPRQCQCDGLAPLKCGPCKKCEKRSLSMQGQEEAECCRSVCVSSNPCERSYKKLFIPLIFLYLLLLSLLVGPVSTSCIDEVDDGKVRQVNRSSRSSWLSMYSAEQMAKRQQDDPDIGPVLEWMKSGSRPAGSEVQHLSPASRHYWLYWDSLTMVDGLLYRRFTKKDNTGSFLQLIVPQVLRNEVMKQMHNALLSGHLGQKKTREKVLQRFYWYGAREDINLWVLRCDVCSTTKPPTKKVRAPLGKLPVGAPLDRLSTDVLGPFPRTPRSNRYILVVSDHFTKWVEVFAIPDYEASTCANVIMNEVIARYGCPLELLTDQGRNYESNLFKDLCQLLEVRKKRTSIRNPRCNGQTERFNRTLIRMIKAYLKGQQDQWDLHLGCLAAAYRATVNESTGLTPNLMMLGREVRLPAEVTFKRGACDPRDEVVTYGQYVTKLRERMEHAHEVARHHLASSTKRQKEYYDSRCFFHTYKPGDLIWWETHHGQLEITPKLRNPYEGPYLILKKLNDLNYVIQLDQKGTQRVVHCNKLLPYRGPVTLPWARNALKKCSS